MRAVFIFIIMAIGLFAFGQRQDTTVRNGMLVEDSLDLSENTIYESFSCEEKPSFPGGDFELIKFIATHTLYPKQASIYNIQGTVYLRFVITKTGEIGKINVLRSIDPILDNEAIRVVKSLPKWNPGKIKGNPVNVWYIVAVKFKM